MLSPLEFRAFARVLSRLALLAVLSAAVVWSVLALHATTLDFKAWETDTRLLTLPYEATHDYVLLGSSHAYLLARFRDNAALTESILGGSVVNLAMPSGGGLRPARLYLEEYLARGNRAKEVIYFLDPFVFFSPGPNDQHKFVYFEPLQLRFLARLIADGYPPRQIFTYVRSKLSYNWLFQTPEPLLAHTGTVDATTHTPERVAQRMDSLYMDGMEEHHFLRYAEELERIMAHCEAHGMRLSLVTMPTLLGPEPGAARMQAWLAEAQSRHTFRTVDFVDALPDGKWFYNLDHINTAGVEQFLHTVLKPWLDARPAA
jgi:hypothetical protein